RRLLRALRGRVDLEFEYVTADGIGARSAVGREQARAHGLRRDVGAELALVLPGDHERSRGLHTHRRRGLIQRRDVIAREVFAVDERAGGIATVAGNVVAVVALLGGAAAARIGRTVLHTVTTARRNAGRKARVVIVGVAVVALLEGRRAGRM